MRQLTKEMSGIAARHLCDRLDELSEEDRAEGFQLISAEFRLWCGKKINDTNRCEHGREM